MPIRNGRCDESRVGGACQCGAVCLFGDGRREVLYFFFGINTIMQNEIESE